MNETTIAKLHRSLVDALRRSRPGSLHKPITVAEIYQDLMPYREARSVVGFEMNADYEHALLRLLAGEGDYARIEPREVRDKLRMELDSPNPDVGLFRSYAACDVWVSLDGADDGELADGEEAETGVSWENEFLGDDADEARADEQLAGDAGDPDDDVAIAEPASASRATRFEIAADAPEDATPERVVEEMPAESDLEADACLFCAADLPAGRMVNFCPYCGSDQNQQPCPACGEVVDPLWRFCVSCGTRVRPLGDHVN